MAEETKTEEKPITLEEQIKLIDEELNRERVAMGIIIQTKEKLEKKWEQRVLEILLKQIISQIARLTVGNMDYLVTMKTNLERLKEKK